jgi:hypothetical protein
MKRIAVLVLVVLLAAAASGFALKGTPNLAIGAELTTIDFDGVGAMLALHIPKVPLFFGFGIASLQNFGDPTLALTVDYWLMHRHLASIFELYVGLGLYGALAFDPSWYEVGLRLPIGLQAWVLKNERLEVFLEAAPAWVPLVNNDFDSVNFQAQVALGFRLWF